MRLNILEIVAGGRVTSRYDPSVVNRKELKWLEKKLSNLTRLKKKTKSHSQYFHRMAMGIDRCLGLRYKQRQFHWMAERRS
jgi:hypothetical protein